MYLRRKKTVATQVVVLPRFHTRFLSRFDYSGALGPTWPVPCRVCKLGRYRNSWGSGLNSGIFAGSEQEVMHCGAFCCCFEAVGNVARGDEWVGQMFPLEAKMTVVCFDLERPER